MIATTDLVELRSYWSPALGDNALSSSPTFAPSGYARFRVEGYALRPDRPQRDGTTGLYTWYSDVSGDYFTTTNPYWRATTVGTVRDGYRFVRLEGWVFSRPHAGTAPLQLWWSPGRADNFSTADATWTNSTTVSRAPDYRRAETLGHVVLRDPNVENIDPAAFHFGTMGGRPAGERDLVVLLANHRDEPLRHSIATIDALFFGPATPNVRDYTREFAHGAFTWRRGGVVRFDVPDDPETAEDETSWHVMWDASDPRMASVAVSGPSGQMTALDGGGREVVAGSGVGASGTFGLADASCGFARARRRASCSTGRAARAR